MLPTSLTTSPLFGLTITLLAYVLSLELHRHYRFLHPLLVTSGLLIAFLAATRTPIPDYRVGGDIITFFLGPATVALAVPIYKNIPLLRKNLLPIAAGLGTGCLTGILSAYLCAKACHATRMTLLSVLSRSVTTPISMEVARSLHGSPELAAAITCLSGVTGALIGPAILRSLGLLHPLPAGLSMGTTAHGIGTATILRLSPEHASTAALAMALNGLLTASLLTPLSPWIQTHL